MQPKRLALAIICAILCAVAFIACQPSGTNKNGGTAEKHKLAFVTNNASDFWTIARMIANANRFGCIGDPRKWSLVFY